MAQPPNCMDNILCYQDTATREDGTEAKFSSFTNAVYGKVHHSRLGWNMVWGKKKDDRVSIEVGKEIPLTLTRSVRFTGKYYDRTSSSTRT